MSDIVDMKPDVIYDWFTRPKAKGEVNSGEEIVEKEGYIPAEAQIMDMMQAGVRLGEYRREKYDYAADEEVPDDAIDPRAFTDPVEADAALRQVKSRLRAQVETPVVVPEEPTEEKDVT